MAVEYGAKGLIGLLTPQANTTVEPECSILLPPGHALIAARLTSGKPTIDERLVDYLEAIDATLDQFANAPVDAVGFACTGASYLVGADREAEMVRRIEAVRHYPFITAANAIADALAALDAKRIAIVSPYDDGLHETGLDYWRSRGFEIAGVSRLSNPDPAFHPIYSLGSDAASTGLQQVQAAGIEAVVMLGTGLPTLAALMRAAGDPLPVLSSNLCLMWRTVVAAGRQKPTAAGLRPWVDGSGWQTRFELQAA